MFLAMSPMANFHGQSLHLRQTRESMKPKLIWALLSTWLFKELGDTSLLQRPVTASHTRGGSNSKDVIS